MSRELSQAFQSPGAIGIDGESVSGRAERKVDDDGEGTNPLQILARWR